MNALIQLTRTISVFLVAGLCYGLLPTAQAVSSDGCLPGGNTAEGCNALLSLPPARLIQQLASIRSSATPTPTSTQVWAPGHSFSTPKAKIRPPAPEHF